ncbi:MJ0042-type zinc finger domain-containing protein [Tautonia sociabilis]|nr:MJ0042-type zinc finger domain-containing protein [Tautonia sociabilis]
MPVRTRCPRCETVLNVPSGAEGRKLKCPRCTTTFRVGDPGASARSSLPGEDTASPVSSPSVDSVPVRRPPIDDEDLPVVSGDLREQFDLPLLREDDDDRPAPRRGSDPGRGPSSGGVPVAPGGPSPYAEADAAGLIEDDEPVRPRRLAGAEARATSRRCSCGGVVPVGMSICPRCGLDQETGTRDTEFDLLEVQAPPPRAPAPPFGVMVVGTCSALVGAGLAIAAVVLYVVKDEAPYRWGFLLLGAVSAFGVFAAVRLLRHRSARLLILALLLGGLIDVASMIVLPILVPPPYEPPPPTVSPTGEFVPPPIPSLTERINWDQVTLGIVILGVAAAVAIYLTSPQVRRYSQGR